MFYAEDMKGISRNGESMSDLRGISEKCADVLKMHEPLVVLDDVVVTVDKEKERLYIVSKEDGACKEFKLGDSGIEKKQMKNSCLSILQIPSIDYLGLCLCFLIKIICVDMVINCIYFLINHFQIK